ncbi:MAG: hypothetical protein ABIO05_06065 [Ferruginibacter sp.]
MYYELKTKSGGTEAVIDDNCGITKFYAIANTLTEHLKIKFLNKIDDAESLDWNFKYKEHLLTLHYNIFNGVSIFPQERISQQKDNSAVTEVAHFLETKAF